MGAKSVTYPLSAHSNGALLSSNDYSTSHYNFTARGVRTLDTTFNQWSALPSWATAIYKGEYCSAHPQGGLINLPILYFRKVSSALWGRSICLVFLFSTNKDSELLTPLLSKTEDFTRIPKVRFPYRRETLKSRPSTGCYSLSLMKP